MLKTNLTIFSGVVIAAVLTYLLAPKQKWPKQPPVIIDIVHGGQWGTTTLEDYKRKYFYEDQKKNIKMDGIACAAGGQIQFATQQEGFPISVLLYPLKGATDIRYFETKTAKADRYNHVLFVERKLDEIKVFNGYLRRFVHPGVEQEVWSRVAYMAKGVMHISAAIKMKIKSKPTEYNPDLLAINDNKLNPKFTWKDGRTKENVIYFMALTDNGRNLVSGTYTRDKYFKFYDLKNVELNIRDVCPAPALKDSERYSFYLMGISKDNWINFIASKRFVVDSGGETAILPGSL